MTSKKAPQAPASAAQLAESTGSAAGLPPAAPAAAAKAGRHAKKPPVASAPPRKAKALPAKSPEKALLTSEEDRRKAPDSPGPAESLLAKSPEKVVVEHVEVKGAAKKESPGRPAHAPGTPKLVTPVKRLLSADLPSEAHATCCSCSSEICSCVHVLSREALTSAMYVMLRCFPGHEAENRPGRPCDGRKRKQLLQMHGTARAASNSLMCGLCRVRGPCAEAPEPAGQDAHDDTWRQQGDWSCR